MCLDAMSSRPKTDQIGVQTVGEDDDNDQERARLAPLVEQVVALERLLEQTRHEADASRVRVTELEMENKRLRKQKETLTLECEKRAVSSRNAKVSQL